MVSIYGRTDIGLVRNNNQDKYTYKILGELLAYAVLCDGMGGVDCGHIASQKAIDFAGQTLERDLKPGMSESSLRGLLMSAVAGANAVVFDSASKDPALLGMGTTMVIAVLSGENIYIASVGDSRAYIFGEGGQRQLTKDHTIVQMLLERGEISPQEAAVHPKRHFITRAVGVAENVDADFSVCAFDQGEVLLICSDGFYNYAGEENLTHPVLYTHLKESVKAESVENLIELAIIGGGGDNVTAVVVAREAGGKGGE